LQNVERIDGIAVCILLIIGVFRKWFIWQINTVL